MNDEERILGVNALNEYATQDNSQFTRPESMDNLWVCRYGVKVRIPALIDSWDIYHKATKHLSAYMDIAAFNDGLHMKPTFYQEVVIGYAFDGDYTRNPDLCEIRMQRFYSK